MKTILYVLPALLLAGTANAGTVAPHRAVYDLSLLRVNEGASLQSASGRLAFEIEGSTCEGFTVNFRMATKYQPKEGDVTVIDTMTTTYEGPGALDFRHQIRESVNGKLRDEHRIKLTRANADGEGEGSISTKPGEDFTVPAGAALPMQHQLRLMALGAAGGGRDSSVVFDGSDDAKSFRAISFVGKEKSGAGAGGDTDNPAAAALKGLGAWPMSVSYFPVEGESDTPDYQVSFDMYENGVATGLVLDYGEFALSGKLSDLKLLDAAKCP